MKFSDPCDQLLEAFVKARSTMVKPQKNRANEHLKSKYADLNAVNDAMGPAMSTNNLLMICNPTHEAGQAKDVMLISVTLIHVPSGQSMSDVIQIPLGKADPQGAGSAISYGRRYAKLAIFDLNAADDDGQRGAERTVEEYMTMIDRCESTEKLTAIWSEVSKNPAMKKALADQVRDVGAALKIREAKKFNAAAPANALKGEKTVTVQAAATTDNNTPAAPAAGDQSDF